MLQYSRCGLEGGGVSGDRKPAHPHPPRLRSDDFYVLSSGLITLETTIDNNNDTLAQQYASEQVRRGEGFWT